MRLMYKKFTAALLAFLMIFSMGGMMRPLAQTNTSQAQTSQEPKVNGGDIVYINETNFPDDNFRKYLLDNTDYTTDDTGKYYTEDQIQNIKEINFINGPYHMPYFIEDAKGIEYFTDLTKLNCCIGENGPLKSLDVSKNTKLTVLDCTGCHYLKSLNVSKNTALIQLNCSCTDLTSLDISNNTALTSLSCDHSRLTSLDTSGLNLKYFDGGSQTPDANCYYNKTNKKCLVLMPEVLGENGDLTKVKITSSGWNYDPNTCIASYSSNGNDLPSKLSYNYATDDKGHQLQVNLNLIK